MLEVQKYLQTHTLEDLTSEFGIKVSIDKEFPHLVALNYDMIASPKTHPVVRDCRGLILYTTDYSVASKSFTRFYNYGEVIEETGQVDFTNSVLSEKMDGSLLPIFFDKHLETWTVSTRGTTNSRNAYVQSGTHHYLNLVCDALGIKNIPRQKNEGQFALPVDQYLSLISEIDMVLGPHLDKERSYVFELVGPHNKIVTKYDESRLVLLAVNDLNTLEEVYGDGVENRLTMIELPTQYKVGSKEEALELLANLNVNSNRLIEGFVVHDVQKGIRAKLKNNVYLQAHRVAGDGEMLEKHILELVGENDEEEFLLYFPEKNEAFAPYIEARNNMLIDASLVYVKAKAELDNGSSMKEISSWLKAEKASFVLSMLGRGLTSVETSFSNLNNKNKSQLIKAYM